MKQWFMSLSQRERNMVSVAAAVVLVFIVYQLLLNPLLETYDRNKRNLAKAEDTIRWMQSAAVEVRNLKGSVVSSRPQGKQFVLGMIDRSIKKANLSAVMKRIQPEGNSGIRLWFENAEFNKLIGWLAQLEKNHGMLVNEINIENTDSPGRVNARLYLES